MMNNSVANPILRGFNPDPSIVRVDDDSYSRPGSSRPSQLAIAQQHPRIRVVSVLFLA